MPQMNRETPGAGAYSGSKSKGRAWPSQPESGELEASCSDGACTHKTFRDLTNCLLCAKASPSWLCKKVSAAAHDEEEGGGAGPAVEELVAAAEGEVGAAAQQVDRHRPRRVRQVPDHQRTLPPHPQA